MFPSFILKRPNLFIAILLFIVVLLTYHNSLHNNFMIDDYGMLIDNLAIKDTRLLIYQFIPNQWKDSLAIPKAGGEDVYYRPLAHAIPDLCYKFFTTNPFGYHLINLLLFAFCCYSIYLLVSKIVANRWWGFLTALFYAVHPINGIFVNYITADVFGVQVAAMAWTVIFFLRSQEKTSTYRRYTWLGLLTFIIALQCHETAIMMPFYLACTAYCAQKLDLKKTLIKTWPFWALLIVYVLFRMFVVSLKGTLFDKYLAQHMTIAEYGASVAKIFWWYLSRLITLKGIVLIWVTPVVRQQIFLWNAGWVIFIGYLILCFKFRRQYPILSWAGLWFAAGFLPIPLGCLFSPQMGIMIEPHWLLTAAIGFFVLWAGVWMRLRAHFPLISYILLIILLAGYIKQSWAMNKLWGDEKNYCRYWLSQTQDCKMFKFFLASAYLREDKPLEAQKYFLQSLEDRTSDWSIYCNLGSIALGQKDFSTATAYYQKALMLRPHSAIIYHNLANAFRLQGDLPQAEEAYKNAIRVDKFFFPSRYILPQLYIQKSNYAAAITLLKDNLALNPREENSALLLIDAYLKNNQLALAKGRGEGLLEASKSPEILTQAAGLLAPYNYPALVKNLFLKALTINPRYTAAYLELGKLLGNYNQFDAAIQVWKSGQRIAPQEPQFATLIKEAQRLKAMPQPTPAP